jgi:peroxiredoxin
MISLQDELNNERTEQGGYMPHVNLQIQDSDRFRIANRIPQAGDMAIDFELPDEKGNKISLDQLCKNGPLILNFFRGNFCDFCKLQLKALQRSMKEFKRYHATLVGISPSLISIQTVTKDSLKLSYSILSDTGNNVAAKYGLKYDLSDELVSIFEGFGINYNENFGDTGYKDPSLPIPATFVINRDKRIVFAFHDSDYTKRAEPADIIASLISIS